MDSTAVIAFAAIVQAAATTILVLVTRRYVMLTASLAKSAEEQIRLGTTPNLHFDGAQGDWRIMNLGPYSAHIQAVYVELLSSDQAVVGRGLLKTDGRMLFGWKEVIGPNGHIKVRQALGIPQFGAKLSGPARLVFYFVYGPTGPRIHAMDVRLDIESLAAANVHGQVIRLNEAPPQLPPTSIDQIQPVTRT
jgi:hypothetical protein